MQKPSAVPCAGSAGVISMSSPKKVAYLPLVLVCRKLSCAQRLPVDQPENLSRLPVPVFCSCTTLFHKSSTHCACPASKVPATRCVQVQKKKMLQIAQSKNRLFNLATLRGRMQLFYQTTIIHYRQIFIQIVLYTFVHTINIMFLFKQIPRINTREINRSTSLTVSSNIKRNPFEIRFFPAVLECNDRLL